jgi:hypothetical protein
LAKNSDGFENISHGYAPEGASNSHAPKPAPIPFNEMVRDVLDNASNTAKAELALLKARGELAKQGTKTASVWGLIAAVTAFVALLTFAVGMVMTLATLIGPLAATLLVTGALLLVAVMAGLRAKRGAANIQVALRRDVFGEGDSE